MIVLTKGDQKENWGPNRTMRLDRESQHSQLLFYVAIQISHV